MNRPSPADLIRLLGLKPLDGEGGYYRETYRAAGPDRAASTAIYYMLTPDTFSALHRLPQDELFHFYLGDPVEQLLLRPDGTGAVRTLGSDLLTGMLPQALVPGGWWQGARLRPDGGVALLGTTVAPGFEFTDYEPGRRERLVREYPAYAERIGLLTHE